MKLDYKSLKFDVMIDYIEKNADELKAKDEKVFDILMGSILKEDGSKNTLAMKNPFWLLTKDVIEFENAPKEKGAKKEDESITKAKALLEKYGKKK